MGLSFLMSIGNGSHLYEICSNIHEETNINKINTEHFPMEIPLGRKKLKLISKWEWLYI